MKPMFKFKTADMGNDLINIQLDITLKHQNLKWWLRLGVAVLVTVLLLIDAAGTDKLLSYIIDFLYS